ncbi:MAG: S1 RNA-binding domain-containing protein [Patescibacteria group bacterium]
MTETTTLQNDKQISAMNQLAKIAPNMLSFLKQGDLIEAKLLARTPKAVHFDLGKYGTGIVYGIELLNAKTIIKNLNIGDPVNAKISEIENSDGFVELSLANARHQKNWQELEELKEKNEPVAIKITGANSGGLVAELLGIKAFLPVSHLSSEHYPRVEKADKGKILSELKKLLGQELNVKIIDLNHRTNKLIISEREAVEGSAKDLIAKYKVGDVIDGIITGIADFGAFVRFADNPAIEGLIHVSELDWRLIDSPKEIVQINEIVAAKIIEIKEDRVFLSLKALKTNPWEDAGDKLKERQDITGVVHKFNPFGAYVDLENGLWGLIHVSEFESLEKMRDKLEIGKTYNFVIESIKTEEKRIVLKLKKEE